MNPTINPTNAYTVPSVSITTARTGASAKTNTLGMRAMQERAYAKRGDHCLRVETPLCLTRSFRQIYLGIYVSKSLSGAAAMSQITLYLDDATQALVDHAAQANGVSKSRWVAELIRKHAAQEWPKECLDLAGKFKDFPLLDADGASGMPADAPRLGF